MAAGKVTEIRDLAEYNRVLSEHVHQLVVVDFTASWCGPCQFIKPKYHAMAESEEYSGVLFLKVIIMYGAATALYHQGTV
ncbi:thioredoxin [archaeon]|nr:MAG: thioredoxin [archaeon]